MSRVPARFHNGEPVYRKGEARPGELSVAPHGGAERVAVEVMGRDGTVVQLAHVDEPPPVVMVEDLYG